MLIRFPDSEYAEPYRAYVNYFEDLAGVVGGLYGVGESLVAGAHSGIAQHLGVGHVRVQRRNLDITQRRSCRVSSVMPGSGMHRDETAFNPSLGRALPARSLSTATET